MRSPSDWNVIRDHLSGASVADGVILAPRPEETIAGLLFQAEDELNGGRGERHIQTSLGPGGRVVIRSKPHI